MPSCNTYCFTWVSLTLDMGYLFTVAPAKHIHLLLTLDEVYLITAAPPDLGHGIAPLVDTHNVNKFGKSAVTIQLEKVSFDSNPKEEQCQRMFKLRHNCTHFTCYQGKVQNLSS